MWCKSDSVKACLSPCSLGLAAGIMKGVCLLLFAWAGWLWGFGLPIIEQVSQVYSGYAASFAGGIIGGVWGLVVGFIAGVIFGWLYNGFLCCCCRKSADKS